MASIRDLLDDLNQLFVKGDVDGLAELYAEDAVLTVPGGRFEGRDQIRGYWEGILRAFPDGTSEIGRHTEAGDVFFGELTSRGTNTGELALPDGATVPAAGRAGVLPGMEFARVSAGKLVEHNWYYDSLSLMIQLGVMPG